MTVLNSSINVYRKSTLRVNFNVFFNSTEWDSGHTELLSEWRQR